MESSELVLFTVSVLPVAIICMYVYSKDSDKEPARLLLKLFVGGIGSCFITLIIGVILKLIFPVYSFDAITELNFFQLMIYAFLFVALVEEFSKWIIAYTISYNDSDFDQLYDAMIYCVFVSLGFAFFENLFYVYSIGVSGGIKRALLSVPSHACNGVFMGYYLGISKIGSYNGNKEIQIKNLILSIVIPMITHGLYDFCLFVNNGIFITIFYIFVISIYIIVLKKIKKISSITRKMVYKHTHCPYCGTVVNSNICPGCGSKND